MRSNLLCLILLICTTSLHAEPLTIAVASNFRSAAEEIAAAFADHTGHTARISSASTGKLYAQIVYGAPFDVFLAADSKHPRLLEEARLIAAGSRQTYAIGGLVLWSRVEQYCRSALDNLGDRRLAIANPKIAPYGLAARQFLESEGIWSAVEPQLVFGESVGQAMQFVATGNAHLGIIAAAQALDPGLPAPTCTWEVPQDQHAPIEQQFVLVRGAGTNQVAAAFAEFLTGPTATAIIRRFGYGVPE
jgi:molybdate transport system substrate-binding protein